MITDGSFDVSNIKRSIGLQLIANTIKILLRVERIERKKIVLATRWSANLAIALNVRLHLHVKIVHGMLHDIGKQLFHHLKCTTHIYLSLGKNFLNQSN